MVNESSSKRGGDNNELERSGGSSSSFEAKGAWPNDEEDAQNDDEPDNSILFGYLSMPYVVYSVIDSIWDLVTVAFLGYPIDYNTLEYVLGIQEYPDNIDDSKSSMLALNFHAFAGGVGLLFMSFQFVTGTFFLGKKPDPDSGLRTPLPRQLHRRIGPISAFAFLVPIVTGFVYLFTSQRLKDKQVDFGMGEIVQHRVYHCLSGTAILVNLILGVIGALRGDYPLHRGSMFFSFFWANFVSLSKFASSVVQCFSEEEVNVRTNLLIAVVLVSIEFPINVYIGYRYGGKAFRRPFVLYNLQAFGALFLTAWIGVILSFAMDDMDSNMGITTELNCTSMSSDPFC